MGKNKKDEKKRKKLRTLILLLFITIIMFGTSTYAWFTANRVVTINALDVHVEASNGIQISTDGATWKSVITRADIISGAYDENVNQLPTDVTAVSTIPSANSSGANQGRLNMYSAVIDTNATTGDYTIETILETDTKGQTGKYIAFDVFLRVDTSQTVYLAAGSDVTVAEGSTEKGLKNAARVAFVKLGETASTSPVATITALNTPGGVILWEPNYDAHQDIITTSVASDMGVTLPMTGSAYDRVPYRGVSAATAANTPLDLKAVVNGTNTTITTAVTPTIATPAGGANYETFATLNAGITKYRVYMWIEGQDIDCDNSATGTNISYKVILSTQNGTSSAAASS